MRNFRYFADISSNNGTVDIGEYAAAGHALIAIKATEGATYVNAAHKAQSDEAHRHGLTVAHYHFCRPGRTSIGDELTNFRRQYLRGWRKGDYVVLDLEIASEGEDLGVYARAFTAEIVRHTGHPPIIYTYLSFRADHLAGVHFSGNRWWMADYTARQPENASWGWQFTDGVNGPQPHTMSGIGQCDVSLLNRPLALRLWVRKQRRGRRAR